MMAAVKGDVWCCVWFATERWEPAASFFRLGGMRVLLDYASPPRIGSYHSETVQFIFEIARMVTLGPPFHAQALACRASLPSLPTSDTRRRAGIHHIHHMNEGG